MGCGVDHPCYATSKEGSVSLGWVTHLGLSFMFLESRFNSFCGILVHIVLLGEAAVAMGVFVCAWLVTVFMWVVGVKVTYT